MHFMRCTLVKIWLLSAVANTWDVTSKHSSIPCPCKDGVASLSVPSVLILHALKRHGLEPGSLKGGFFAAAPLAQAVARVHGCLHTQLGGVQRLCRGFM